MTEGEEYPVLMIPVANMYNDLINEHIETSGGIRYCCTFVLSVCDRAGYYTNEIKFVFQIF